MKKITKIFLIVVFTIVLITMTKHNSYAVETNGLKLGLDLFDKGIWGTYLKDDTAIDIDIEIGTTDQINEANEFTEKILAYLQVLGAVIAVIALVVIGLRYMFSTVEEKAQMKGVLIYYIVGAALVFATTSLLSLVYRVFESL